MIVVRRLEESLLAEQATDLLLAALQGAEILSAQLGGKTGQRPCGDPADKAPTAGRRLPAVEDPLVH